MKTPNPNGKCATPSCNSCRAKYRFKCLECDPVKKQLFLFHVISDLDSNLRAIVWAECKSEAIRIAWEAADENETFLHADAKEIMQPEVQTLLMLIDKV